MITVTRIPGLKISGKIKLGPRYAQGSLDWTDSLPTLGLSPLDGIGGEVAFLLEDGISRGGCLGLEKMVRLGEWLLETSDVEIPRPYDVIPLPWHVDVWPLLDASLPPPAYASPFWRYLLRVTLDTLSPEDDGSPPVLFSL
ncbi:hypothetical protein GCK72_003392 [Caenorhabditis remanei]|uniref:Uncharacterized protein n=1 Tax=Caenorhabditis remanei TaxID=31234 RepID=A0A6A5HV91_CAERE|nr:hypothetical protein GCK72_003392 [Caenorhabditis remanei]KAF1771565.1 hypothetical protein GCK72_003392 [Caenorhabditis remanei]